MMASQVTDQHGGTDSFICKLPAALATLCSLPSGLQDDTILHRLLDLIKHLVVTADSVTTSGLQEFLATVSERPSDLHPSVVVLALGTAAHLSSIASTDDDVWTTATSVFDAVQTSGVLDNSSIGAAYFTGLAVITSSRRGLAWLEKKNTHIQTALATLESAGSIFLLSAVESFVVGVITQCMEQEQTGFHDNKNTVASETVSILLDHLSKIISDAITEKQAFLDGLVTASHASSRLPVSCQIIKRLTELSVFCQKKTEDISFIEALVHLSLYHPENRVHQSALHSVVNIFAHMEASAQGTLLSEKVLPPLLNLIAKGEVERGVSIAARFDDSGCHGDSPPMLTLQSVRQLPHDALFSRQPACPQLPGLLPIVAAALCNRLSLARLTGSILHSLKQTQNSRGLVRLLRSASAVREDAEWQSLLSGWPLSVGTTITGNTRLLSSLLQCLQDSNCPDLDLPETVDVLTCLLKIMGRPQMDSRLISQATASFLAVLGAQCDHGIINADSHIHNVLGQLVTLLERSLVSTQWETRDSTLEFISKLITLAYQDTQLQKLLREHHVLRQAWTCLKDGESYPRASTIAMATALRQKSSWWQVFLEDCDISEMVVVQQMVEVLGDAQLVPSSAPPGGPARREAVQLLAAVYQHSTMEKSHQTFTDLHDSPLKQMVCVAMKTALGDSDWEVKVKALEFWEVALSPILKRETSVSGDDNHPLDTQVGDKCPLGKHKQTSDHESKSNNNGQILASLLKCGLEEALFTAAEDFDNAVSEKACHILLTLQKSMGVWQHSPSKVPRRHTADTGNRKTHPLHADTHTPEHENGDHARNDCVAVNDNAHPDNVLAFLAKIDGFDPAEHLKRLTVSIDEYDRRPESLLEDVMAAAKMAATAAEAALASEDEFDDGEDIFVDCY